MGRDLTRRERSLTTAAVLLGVFPAAWAVRPWIEDDLPVLCAFRLLTGWRCPFCGLTHAFAYAVHCEFHRASAAHPLWPVAALFCLGVGLLALADAVIGANDAPRLAGGRLLDPRWAFARLAWLVRRRRWFAR
jgi:hypothetical protein